MIDCADRDAAIAAARDLREVNSSAIYEIRPVTLYLPGVPFPATEAGGDEQTKPKANAEEAQQDFVTPDPVRKPRR